RQHGRGPVSRVLRRRRPERLLREPAAPPLSDRDRLRFTGTTRNRQEPLGGEIATDAPELLAGDRAVLQPVAVGIDHGMVQAGSNAGWGEMAVAVHTGPPALTLTSCRQS